MSSGLSMEIVWFDEDLLEVRARANNGRFAGTARFYDAHTAPAELAAALRGFPRSVDDRREFMLGTLDPAYASGGCRIRLRCSDRSGHAVAEIRLESREESAGSLRESVELDFSVEAGAIDRFVVALSRMGLVPGASAELRAAT